MAPKISAGAQAQGMLALARAQTNAPTGANGAFSPLVAQMENWSMVYAPALPRPRGTFTAGSFGPMWPLNPQGIDENTDYGFPRPRRFQYPVGWNLPIGVPGTEGIKLANFQQLREFAQRSSICRTLVDMCKADIMALIDDLSDCIVATPEAEKAMQGDPAARADFEKRKNEAVQFFEDPDPDNYDGFDDWMMAILEDMIVLDAVAVHVLPTMMPGKGPFGSSVGALEVLDGSTIRPLLTIHGTRPRAPSPAYQQYLWGVPRSDLMEVVNLGPDASLADYEALNPFVEDSLINKDEFMSTQLFYIRTNPMSNTPYGFGPVEEASLPIAVSLARQIWQREFFDAGSLPRVFMDPGETIATPEEARQIQTAINQMGGDLAAMWQVIVTPPGAKMSPQKDATLTDEFDEWITVTVAMPFGYKLPDLGITPKIAAITSPEASRAGTKSGADKTTQRGLKPRIMKLKRLLFDRVIRDVWGQKDMEWSWGLTESGDSRGDQINQWMAMAGGAPLVSIDEARVALQMEPLGLESTSVPILVSPATGTGVLISSITAETSDAIVTPPEPEPPKPPMLALPPGTTADQLPAAKPAAEKPAGEPEHGEDSAGDLSPDHYAAEANQETSPSATGSQQKIRAEVQVLARYMKRGGKPVDFRPKVLRVSALKAGAHTADHHKAIARVVSAHEKQAKRDGATAALSAGIAAGLGRLVNGVVNGATSPGDFLTQANRVMHTGISGAYAAGAGAALVDTSDNDNFSDTTPDFTQQTSERVGAQSVFLAGLLAAALASGTNTGPSMDDLSNRVQGYASQVVAPYEEGYGTTYSQNAPDDSQAVATWLTEDDPCDLCAPRDGTTYQTSQLDGMWPGDGGFGDVCEGAMNCRCTLDWDLAPADADTQDLNPYDTSTVGKAVGATGAVMAYLKKNYQDKDLSWVQTMTWATPRAVTLSGLSITTPIGGDNSEREKDLEDKLKNGFVPHPLVMVTEAGKTTIVDGHHRAYAARRAGLTTLDAYVGTPGPQSRGWQGQVADMQGQRTNAKPTEDEAAKMHRAAGWTPGYRLTLKSLDGYPIAAGLAVRAQDSGRVLLLQRSNIDESDPARGTWEFPGGKLETGEAAADAAKREWQEETGQILPPTEFLGSWRAGVYQCFVVQVPSEDAVNIRANAQVVNPDDPDGDITEALAWWDPTQLPAMAALRPELRGGADWGLLTSGAPSMAQKDSAEGERGAQALREWYESGADGGIDWGSPGDWQQCVDIAGQYIDDPEGYCQLRHMAATGMTTSEHAEEEK